MAVRRKSAHSVQRLVPVDLHRTRNGRLGLVVRICRVSADQCTAYCRSHRPTSFCNVRRDSPSAYRRKDSAGQSTVSHNHSRSESATIGKQNRYQTTTLTRFGDSLSHRNPYPVSLYMRTEPNRSVTRFRRLVSILYHAIRSRDIFTFRFAQTRSRANSRLNGHGNNGPPPPSVPAPVVPRQYGGHVPPPASFFPPPPQSLPPAPGKAVVDKRTGGVNHQHGNASLHSSNDSGFSNDPPPAPEVDYSDDENTRYAHRSIHSSLNYTPFGPAA